MKQFVRGEFSRPAAIWIRSNPYLFTNWTLKGQKNPQRSTERQLKKGPGEKKEKQTACLQKVNRGAARNSRKNRGSAKCRLEFPQGMSRNGTLSRADAIFFLGLPRKRIVSNKLGISHNGYSPALCWLRQPESNVDWHRPACIASPRHSSPQGKSTNCPARTPHGRRDSTLMESRRPILPGSSHSFAASFCVPHKNARPCCHERARERRVLSCSIGNSTCRRRCRRSPLRKAL